MQNEKSRSGNSGSRTNLNGHLRKPFLNANRKGFLGSNQCKKCGSDYLRFALAGYCQRCLQRLEFVIRERAKEEDSAA